MRRREFIAGVGSAGTLWAFRAKAQQPGRHWRIGVLSTQPLAPIARFRLKLEELGYTEGRNLSTEARFSMGRDELYPSLASELISASVDLILAWGTPAALAAKHATSTVPIVIVAGDVLNTGIVSNLANPGGNVTGFSAVNVELEGKRLELLRELVPGLARVGVLANAGNRLNQLNLDTVRAAASAWGLSVEIAEVRQRTEIDAALDALAATTPDAILLASDTLLLSERTKIVEFMAFRRIPAIYPFREYAEGGGLIAHGANIPLLFERAASYVDRILKGTKPGDLPVQQATAFELIINTRVAAALAPPIPPTLLARADEVIE